MIKPTTVKVLETTQPVLRLGLTGFRLNLSHRTLADCRRWTDALRAAGEETGIRPELIIDLRGAELRLGELTRPLRLREGDSLRFGRMGLPLLEEDILAALRPGQTILMRLSKSESNGFTADTIAQNSGIDYTEKGKLLCQMNPTRRLESIIKLLRIWPV